MKKKAFYEKLGYIYVLLSVKLNKFRVLPKLAEYLLDRGSMFYIHGSKKRPTLEKVTDHKPGLKQEWIYTWRFHFNPYTQEWNAYHIDDAREYMNGQPTKHPVIKTQSMEAMLMSLLVVNNKDHKNLYGC